MKLREKHLSFRNGLPAVILGCIAVLLAVRAFFGFNGSDESYYLALPYRFAMGDRFVLDSWDMQQFSALLTAPFLWLYHLFFRNMTGIFLVSRLLFVLFQLAISIFLYATARRLQFSRIVATLASALFFSFVPFSISNFSYNTMGYSDTVLTCALILFLYAKPCARRVCITVSLLAGIVFGFACLANPYFFVVIIPLCVVFAVWKPEIAGVPGKKRAWPVFVLFLAGGALVALITAAYLLTTVGLSPLLHNLPYLFQDPDHPHVTLRHNTKLAILNYFHWSFLPQLQIALIALCGIFSLIKKKWKSKTPDRLLGTLLGVLMPVCIVWGIGYIAHKNSYSFTIAINLIQLGMGLWPLAAFAFRPSRKKAILLFGAYFPSYFLYWTIYLSSNNGVVGASYALNLAALSGLLILADFYAGFLREYPIRRSFAREALKTVLAVVAAFAVLCNLYLRFAGNYRDAPIPSLNTRITSGPAVGLITTRQNADEYEGIVADIKKYTPAGGGIMIPKWTCYGYLCVSARPTAPTIYLFGFPSERADIYFQINSHKSPSLIYDVKNGAAPLTMADAEKLMGPDIQNIQTKYGNIFVKATPQ